MKGSQFVRSFDRTYEELKLGGAPGTFGKGATGFDRTYEELKPGLLVRAVLFQIPF